MNFKIFALNINNFRRKLLKFNTILNYSLNNLYINSIYLLKKNIINN